MTVNQISYIMTHRIANMLVKKGIAIKCRRCQQIIIEGEWVHRKISGGRSKIYHVKCWDSLFYEEGKM